MFEIFRRNALKFTLCVCFLAHFLRWEVYAFMLERQSCSTKGFVHYRSSQIFREFKEKPFFVNEQASDISNDKFDSRSSVADASTSKNDEIMAMTSMIEKNMMSDDALEVDDAGSGFSYGEFAKSYPFINNVMIASLKTAAADFIAQSVIAQTPLDQIDWERNLLFGAFGAFYLGMFQYAYQVNIFKKLFDVDKFTSQSWEEKLKDGPGLKALAAQTALDLTVLTAIYLPTFYIFKASVFSGSTDPIVWARTGFDTYQTNFAKDEIDLIKVWAPADLICFSVPLYLRLPVRHVVSFVWTAYLSFARGGH